MSAIKCTMLACAGFGLLAFACPFAAAQSKAVAPEISPFELLKQYGSTEALSGQERQSQAEKTSIAQDISARTSQSRALNAHVKLKRKNAKKALKALEKHYGEPEKRADGTYVWSVLNLDRGADEAKISTITAREIEGKMVIIADRTPISRRVPNKSAPRPPGSPIRSYHPHGKPADVPNISSGKTRAIKPERLRAPTAAGDDSL